MININSEEELQRQVVKYLNKTELLFTCTLGGYLDTEKARIDSRKDGYRKGVPDLMIYSPCSEYKGFAIEFKSPLGNGKISREQERWLSNLEVKCGWFVMCSNNYDEILECLFKYINEMLP